MYLISTLFLCKNLLCICMLSFFLFGISICLKDDKHVRIDVISNKLDEKIKRVIEKLGLVLLIIPFCIFVIYESSPMILRSWDMLEGSSEPGGLPFTLSSKNIYLYICIINFIASFKKTN